MNIKEIKEELAKALTAHRAMSETATHSALRKSSDEVEALQKKLSDAICEGAEDCPDCKLPPVGMEHGRARAGSEFEIGCRKCSRRVRGGLMAKHSVEAWNESLKS